MCSYHDTFTGVWVRTYTYFRIFIHLTYDMYLHSKTNWSYTQTGMQSGVVLSCWLRCDCHQHCCFALCCQPVQTAFK